MTWRWCVNRLIKRHKPTPGGDDVQRKLMTVGGHELQSRARDIIALASDPKILHKFLLVCGPEKAADGALQRLLRDIRTRSRGTALRVRSMRCRHDDCL